MQMFTWIGGGKSTCISLLERFYDPLQGRIEVDGEAITSFNLKWLRTQISLVNQEPVLLSGTIADNIRVGKPTATQEEVENAARMANAYNFIMLFPDQFETLVGDKGSQLSGGQKQRIAIARAIIRDPRILLLDEATSALDNESERIVQEALDRLTESAHRTTLVVAHRLSTIRHADKIVVVGDGGVLEEGTHDELMARHDGIYARMVSIQQAHN